MCWGERVLAELVGKEKKIMQTEPTTYTFLTTAIDFISIRKHPNTYPADHDHYQLFS